MEHILDDIKKCTGCGACVQICPTCAITMHEIDFFIYPKIDIEKCINCSKCRESCPELF